MCTSSDKEAALTTAYQEVCTSYHAIDDVRIRLMGLLPLVSGAGIVVLLRPDVLDLEDKYYPPIGIFGFLVTLGLLLFEVRGVQQCYALIALGKDIEKSLHIEAQFTHRPKQLVGLGKTSAARVIYPAVLAAWTFITLFKLEDFKLIFNEAAVIALCLGVVGFIISFILTRYFEVRYLGRHLEHNDELRFRDWLLGRNTQESSNPTDTA
jgi:hypothetical protein